MVGWDYAEDHIWPDTNTLYIVGILSCYKDYLFSILTVFTPEFPYTITIDAGASSLAREKYPDLLGDYTLGHNALREILFGDNRTHKLFQLRRVYKKETGDEYIFYDSKF